MAISELLAILKKYSFQGKKDGHGGVIVNYCVTFVEPKVVFCFINYIRLFYTLLK